jgi:hypothetical protein
VSVIFVISPRNVGCYHHHHHCRPHGTSCHTCLQYTWLQPASVCGDRVMPGPTPPTVITQTHLFLSTSHLHVTNTSILGIAPSDSALNILWTNVTPGRTSPVQKDPRQVPRFYIFRNLPHVFWQDFISHTAVCPPQGPGGSRSLRRRWGHLHF